MLNVLMSNGKMPNGEMPNSKMPNGKMLINSMWNCKTPKTPTIW